MPSRHRRPLTQRQRLTLALHCVRCSAGVASLVATGVSNQAIARRLRVAEKTARNTLTVIFAKTGTQSRVELAVQAVRQEGPFQS